MVNDKSVIYVKFVGYVVLINILFFSVLFIEICDVLVSVVMFEKLGMLNSLNVDLFNLWLEESVLDYINEY